MTAMLEARSLSFTVGGARLVDAIDLRIGAGEMVAIVGPNGAGKSTLLRMLSGDLRPTGGQVLLRQREIHTYPPRRTRAASRDAVAACQRHLPVHRRGDRPHGRGRSQPGRSAAAGRCRTRRGRPRTFPAPAIANAVRRRTAARAFCPRAGAARLRRGAARAGSVAAGRADLQPRHAPPDRFGGDSKAAREATAPPWSRCCTISIWRCDSPTGSCCCTAAGSRSTAAAPRRSRPRPSGRIFEVDVTIDYTDGGVPFLLPQTMRPVAMPSIGDGDGIRPHAYPTASHGLHKTVGRL